MGRNAWISSEAIRQFHAGDWTWSWLWYVESPFLIWLHQLIAIVASFLMAFGLMTRFVVPITWFLTLMVCHRATGALFGLDQIVVMLSMYLMISPCGSVFSIDAYLCKRWGQCWWLPVCQPTTAANIATRLIQLHLCVIYVFGGLSKMRGPMWWDGNAMWYSLANYEYQSIDMTWLGRYPFFLSVLTAGTIFWETFYCALVWPRVTRPIMLAMAVAVHSGIGLFLGMITFGAIMIVANFAFLSPEFTRSMLSKVWRDSSSDKSIVTRTSS